MRLWLCIFEMWNGDHDNVSSPHPPLSTPIYKCKCCLTLFTNVWITQVIKNKNNKKRYLSLLFSPYA